MNCNEIYDFEPKVKYSSNPNQIYAIVSIKNQSKLNFLPENTPIKITNPFNDKFTICKILYDSNVKADSIYLSTQTIKSLKIKMFKKIKLESVKSEITYSDKIVIRPISSLDYDNFYNIKLWEKFIKPYFSEENKICTIGDIIIMNIDGDKIKFIIDCLVDFDGNYSITGIIHSKTEVHYVSNPINCIDEFYDSNKFIKYNYDSKKFEIIYDFIKSKKIKKSFDISTLNLSVNDKENGLYHNITFFTFYFVSSCLIFGLYGSINKIKLYFNIV